MTFHLQYKENIWCLKKEHVNLIEPFVPDKLNLKYLVIFWEFPSLTTKLLQITLNSVSLRELLENNFLKNIRY